MQTRVSTYFQMTSDRIHEPLRAALKAGDEVWLRYSYARDYRYKKAIIIRRTKTRLFIKGEKWVKGETVECERAFAVGTGYECGTERSSSDRDRLHACTPDLNAYVAEHKAQLADDRFRKDAISTIQGCQLRSVSSKTLQTILDLLEADDGEGR